MKEKSPKYAELEVSEPTQLSLFSLLPQDRNDFSHTVELYDFLPKFVYGKKERIQGQFLNSVDRDFVHRQKDYKLKLRPGRITDQKTGKDKDVFLGKREELVEDALRKMAADGTNARTVYLNNQLSVVFSRYALQTELKEQGHTYDYQQIEEAINILFSVKIEIFDEQGNECHKFSPVSAYGFRGRDGENQTYIMFSPLVTNSIEKNSFRLVNYRKLMSYKTVIARRLHKRLSHHFIQASKNDSYHISLSTMYRDFGLEAKRIKHQYDETIPALEELVAANILEKYEVSPIFDAQRKNKKTDYVFDLYPHQDFINEVIKANKDVQIRKYLPDQRSSNRAQIKSKG